MARLLVCALLLMLAACGSSAGPEPTQGFTPLASPDWLTQDGDVHEGYRIAPLDKITVTVFGQEKMSVEEVQVDASGHVVLPLVGAVLVKGKTAQEVSTEVEGQLGRYLQSPNVTVSIVEAIGQRVTVTGAVKESGVYTLKGPTTLVQAIAMAKGPDPREANLKHVAIFRLVEGRRARAVFDVAAIRNGMAQDPEVFGGDTVVVESSRAKAAWREIVGALPGIGVFAWF